MSNKTTPITPATSTAPVLAPTMIIFGEVGTLTQGTGGDYLDEGTSGHWPGDDDDDDNSSDDDDNSSDDDDD